MIDDLSAARPQSGLSSASVVWQAPAEGGIPRYMAIFQDTLPKSIGPVRSSRYYYIAWAAEWRAIYAHAGGSPGAKATLQAKGSGQYVYNVDEFRYSGTFFRINDPLLAAQPVHDRARSCARLGKRIGAKDKAYKPVWKFAPDAPLEARPYGGTITVTYPYNTIRYKYDRDDQHLPALGDRREEADRRGDRRRGSRRRTSSSCGCASGRSTTAIPGRRASRPTSSAAGRPGSRPTAGRSRAPGRRPSVTKPTQFYDAKGNEVTLTIGQTFVQVMPSTTGYPAVVQGRLGPAAGHARAQRPRRLTGAATSSGPSNDYGRADPDRGVDRPGLARHVGPGPAVRLGALAGGRGDAVVDAVVGPDRGQGDGQPVRVARLDEEPGRADQLGEWPDRRRDDRRPAGERLDGRQAGRLRDDGQDRRAGAADQRRPGPAPGRPGA